MEHDGKLERDLDELLGSGRLRSMNRAAAICLYEVFVNNLLRTSEGYIIVSPELLTDRPPDCWKDLSPHAKRLLMDIRTTLKTSTGLLYQLPEEYWDIAISWFVVRACKSFVASMENPPDVTEIEVDDLQDVDPERLSHPRRSKRRERH